MICLCKNWIGKQGIEYLLAAWRQNTVISD